MEIVSGLGCLGFGVVLWNAGWWHWVLVGMGLVGVSPWLGVQHTIRRIDQNPERVVRDPQRRRSRARRSAVVVAGGQAAFGFVVGYLLDGWPAALFMLAATGLSGVVGVVWVLRREGR